MSMREFDTNLYYALVWSDELATNKKLVIKGEVIDKTTKLPDDPRILYGAHPNDTVKITKITEVEELGYDCRTGIQSSHSWTEAEEYNLRRDVCILVWPRGDTLYTEYEDYRIVTPQVFECIANRQPGPKNHDNKDESSKWIKYENPKVDIKKTLFDRILSGDVIEYI